MIPRFVYGAAVFLSALLLFLVQPILAVVMLPWFGGSAGVWVTTMFFFQAVLLLGYLYADWGCRFLTARAQIGVHAAALLLSLALLPLHPERPVAMAGGHEPVWRVLWLLARSAGLPALVLAATSPLVQSWSARTVAGVPYRLFAVSNAASLAALLAYPVAVEPALPKSDQLRFWSAGYAGFAVLMFWCALQTRRDSARSATHHAVPGRERWLWLALSAGPSALWLAVANQISQSVAPAPLMWILPLSGYLLSLALCFYHGIYRPRLFRWLIPPALAGLALAMNQHDWSSRIGWGLALFLGGLFVCCMVCHGELYALRPHPAALTSFYLMIATGGAAGGLFVSLLAPVLFSSLVELPIAIVACTLLTVPLLYGYRSRRDLARLGLISLAALIAAAQVRESGGLHSRNFYGVLEVRENSGAAWPYRALHNGSILHGSQYLAPGRSREPTTYFSRLSGVGLEVERLRNAARRVGVIGLGAGTLAAYGREGDTFRFYELNPAVIDLARTRFRFLQDSAARIEIAPGDARLSLEQEPPQNFDLLVVDAFSGDAMPIHLLTQEAFALYFRHLKPDGAVAVNVTSKYLNLAPLVGRVAASLGRQAQVIASGPDVSRQILSATWVVLKGTRPPVHDVRVWTDDFTSLLTVFR